MGAVYYLEVVLPLALPMDTLTYSCTFAGVGVGVRVRVPLGGGDKTVVGVVSSVSAALPSGLKADSLRPVLAVLDSYPLVSPAQMDFFRWLGGYYMIGLGEVLRSGLSPLFSSSMDGLKSPRKRKVIDNQEVNGSVSEIFSGDNKNRSIVLAREIGPVDYGAVIAELLEGEKGGTVLVLCPTHRAAERMATSLSSRYQVSIYTPQRTIRARARTVVDCAAGVAGQVVVGTRAALWLNIRGLRGVILSQEHSYYYRSAAPPFVSGREGALMLAAIMGVRCVVCSAYPLVESYYNSHHGQWGRAVIGSGAGAVESIVLERGKGLLASYTTERIAKVLEQGKRVVLLQNRRGLASYIECAECGHVPGCPNCSVSLTLHSHGLGCHYCGYHEPAPEGCAECGGVMQNRGRGTQQIENQLVELFPEARIVRLDSDSLTTDKATAHAVFGSKEGEWDIVIGTAIVVEELNWAGVGLAAVLNVDNMLTAADFRVDEKAFRTLGLMHQRCAGAGAEFVVQSSKLGHRAVDFALDLGRWGEFYEGEIEAREGLKFPPHSRMLRFDVRGAKFAGVMELAGGLEGELRAIFGGRLSGIYQPVVERQAGQYVVEMMLRVERGASIARAKALISSTLRKFQGVCRKQKVEVMVEVDP